ncbi:MAG: urease accessory protein UreD [Candidatus Rokubacteria bacterium]|nr:urease accessory protein UreD [Candidatus Rokubacteria bacterium]
MTPAAVAPPPAARTGRDGTLRLGFERRGDRTVLAHSAYTLPLQVMAPVALDDAAAIVAILNPTGGLVGGDRLTIDVAAGGGAHALLTTPSATKVYRSAGDVAEQRVRMTVGPGALVEWVPDHTIPFAGSAFRQAIDVEIAPAGRLVLVDAFAAGRVARGESWRFAHLESALAVHDARGPILHDRFVLAGPPVWDGLGVTESHAYFGSIVVVADVDLDALARALDALDVDGFTAAAARLGRRGVLLRGLATAAPALMAGIDEAWARARASLGLPRLALRKS